MSLLNDADTTVTWPEQEDADQRVTVEVRLVGLPRLVLFFGRRPDDAETPYPLLGFELGEPADSGEEMTKAAAVRAVANLDLLVTYARASIMWNLDEVDAALALFELIGKTKRGMPREFYSAIADEYREREAAGEPHLVKAIAEGHDVTPSAASRWISAARKHGYLDNGKGA